MSYIKLCKVVEDAEMLEELERLGFGSDEQHRNGYIVAAADEDGNEVQADSIDCVETIEDAHCVAFCWGRVFMTGGTVYKDKDGNVWMHEDEHDSVFC